MLAINMRAFTRPHGPGFALALLILLITRTGLAAPQPQLPDVMVMVSPPLKSVAYGLVVPRLVHARFDRKPDHLSATIQFIGASNRLASSCRVHAKPCLPNVRGMMRLSLGRGHTSPAEDDAIEIRQGPEWTIDDTARDAHYYREIRALITGNNLQVRSRDGAWTLIGDSGVRTTWRPMSLKQASDAAYFVATLKPSALDIEQCVADQLAQLHAVDAHTDEQTSLLAAVSLIADKARARDRIKRAKRTDAFVIEFAAQLLSRTEQWPQDADAFIHTPPFDGYAESTGKRAMLHARFQSIANAARYLHRLDNFYATYPEDADQARIICEDLATLEPE